MSRIESIYQKLPVIAQHAAVSTYGYYWNWLRFGSGYKQYLDEYVHRESFSASEWASWQSKRLKDVLNAAVNVPHYSKSWTIAQKKDATRGILTNLPLLEKEPIRRDPLSFLDPEIRPRRKLQFSTSGSTGTPINTVWTIAELRKSMALREARSAGWAKVSFTQARATFSGRMVEPDPDSKGPFYRYNLAEKQVYFSPFHLRPETAKQYVDAIHRHQIKWMTGYAVSFYLLAKFIIKQKLEVSNQIRAVITTSEKLTNEMRKVIESAFHCKVYEEYSTVENVIFASECDNGSLHISPEVSLVEILRPDGSKCFPGEPGEVVVTSLMRTYQPFIRFRLGDEAIWDDNLCTCGRQMPIIKEVIGRLEDVVIGPDGREMVRFHGIFTNQPNIVEGQIIQESINSIIVKVVTTNNFNEKDNQEIVSRVKQRLGQSVSVKVESVESIPRTKAGKFKAVISDISDSA